MPGRLARVALEGACSPARFEYGGAYGDDDESHGGMLRLSTRL
ncbi:hypothetical protein [Poseidonocella sp. HB161398]|nr:hypothetical protein [Poseidonocella sp. HB161398]